jgi:hypothetical protein
MAVTRGIPMLELRKMAVLNLGFMVFSGGFWGLMLRTFWGAMRTYESYLSFFVLAIVRND